MTAEPPEIEVLGELGRGATGVVEHGRLTAAFAHWPAGTEVAVKRLLPEHACDATARKALAAEAAAARSARNDSLVRVLHHGDDGDAAYLVMEHVAGTDLRERLTQEGPLPEPLLRRVGEQVAGGLAALHEAGFAHGDVKPENVRVDDTGRAVVVDLGFATPDARGSDAGTALYLAPERIAGGPPSPAADVYALGLTLWELAVGRHPRNANGEDGDDELVGITGEAPSLHAAQLSPLFDALVLAALAERPGERPTAEELGARLSDGEAGSWWRARIDHGPDARRGVGGEVHAGHLTPLVGRERELRVLFELAAAAHGLRGEPRGALAWLIGEAGAGKSRLVSDFAARAREVPAPPLYLYARCTTWDAARPHGPLRALLNRWLSLPQDAAPGARERELVERLVPPRDAALLLRLVDPDEEDALTDAQPGVLTRWLTRIADAQPLILFLDDVQRADEPTLDTLSRIVDSVAGRQILLLLGRRNDEEPAIPRSFAALDQRVERVAEGSSAAHAELLLEPLAQGDVLELVTRLFHHSTPRLRLANELWSRCHGLPGLAAEILRDLCERGHAFASPDDPDRLVLSIAPDEIPLPGSLQRSIAERYRRLAAEERSWLERLAVVGGRIHPDFLLAAFPPTSRAEIDGVLARLVATGWLATAGHRYRFARPALREAVYRSMSASRRRRLHAMAAQALAADPGEPLSIPDAFQRAFHLRAAGHPSSLLRVLRPLAKKLVELGRTQRVHTLALWGLEALDQLASTPARDRLRIEFLELATDGAGRLGRRDEERRLLDRLADLELDSERDPDLAARVFLLHGRYAAATGEYGLARGWLRNAAELAERAGSTPVASDALRRLALVQSQVGELADARVLARRAARATREPVPLALAWLASAQIAALEDRNEHALSAVDRARRLLRSLSPAPVGVLAFANMLRARVFRSLGLPARALGSARLALSMARAAGERRLESEAGARLGSLLVDLDRVDEAEQHLREALLLAREIEDRRGEVLAAVFLGTLLGEENDREAVRLLATSLARATEIGFFRAEALARAILSRLHLADGDAAGAERESERAEGLVEQHGSELSDRVVIVGTRALVLRATGGEERADAALRRPAPAHAGRPPPAPHRAPPTRPADVRGTTALRSALPRGAALPPPLGRRPGPACRPPARADFVVANVSQVRIGLATHSQ